MIELSPKKGKHLNKGIDDDLVLQNIAFIYKKYPRTIFVPIYPRAHVEEIIGIDYQRRTVTARFVIHLTVNLGVQDPQLKQYLRRHLILEFGYNQVIYIPELMKLDNPPYVIQQVFDPVHREDYVTYKIKGNLQCAAFFDLMLFPYRQVNVVNHLVIRSQVFGQYEIKYNAMKIKRQEGGLKVNQFSPFFIYPEFAGYTIKSESIQIHTDQHVIPMRQQFLKQQSLLTYPLHFFNCRKDNQSIQQADYLSNIIIPIVKSLESEGKMPMDVEQLPELSPFKHISFCFEMTSLKIAFVLQNQIPIWVLGVVSLYLFESKPDIGNRFGNAILIVVSQIALLTNFRLNHVAQHSVTFFEIKMMLVMVVPILVIISTTIDYYSDPSSPYTLFNSRSSQFFNPFMYVSTIIYGVSFLLTLLFMMYLVWTNFTCQHACSKIKCCAKRCGQCYYCEPQKSQLYKDHYLQELWENLQELDWSQDKLNRKMSSLVSEDNKCLKLQGYDMEIVSNAISKCLLKKANQSNQNDNRVPIHWNDRGGQGNANQDQRQNHPIKPNLLQSFRRE